ncbi:MAG: DUF2380 domain-containing protein [Myxococcaceae bacterium]|nr:DUF2380 domain-containing protein [Myxococcaceae bacterium]
MTGCAPLTPPPGSQSNLSYSPSGDAEPAWVQPPPSRARPQPPQRLHLREEFPEKVTRVRSASAAEPERQNGTLTREAVLGAVRAVSGSMGHIAHSLPTLANEPRGLGGRSNGVFSRFILYGSGQLPWLHGALGDVTTLAGAASELDDPGMELAILRLTGPRLQAAMSGATLLAAWLDFLHLADAVLRKCPAYGSERLWVDMERVQNLLAPFMAALASQEPERVQAAAVAMPELMGQLTREFQAIRDKARVASERAGQAMAAEQLVELLTLGSAMKRFLPRLPPSAPALSGTGLVMSASGVMMGSQLIVTVEWVETMRRLVQAGVLSASAVSAAVRLHAGQVMMAQANQELPRGVRDALGDGPEVRAMHETGKAGAGMAERPRHHVLPEEFREFFEKRGFTGPLSIDQFCVELEVARHQAIHGGGHWRLGRLWPGEWNQMIMKALRKAEARVGRMLTPGEILKIVAEYMEEYRIPMNFTPGRRR